MFFVLCVLVFTFANVAICSFAARMKSIAAYGLCILTDFQSLQESPKKAEETLEGQTNFEADISSFFAKCPNNFLIGN